jgi:hypothetical protein
MTALLAMLVLFPVRSCLQNIFGLAFLRTTPEQDNELITVSPEIDPVTGAEINSVLDDVRTDRP